jgi:hypothetical protein
MCVPACKVLNVRIPPEEDFNILPSPSPVFTADTIDPEANLRLGFITTLITLGVISVI